MATPKRTQPAKTARKTSSAKTAKPAKTARTAKRAKAAKTAKTATLAKPMKSAPASTASKYGSRTDFGKSIDSFFDKQPPALREVLVELRKLVEAAAPDATSSIKWGMPFFQIGDKMFVALG